MSTRLPSAAILLAVSLAAGLIALATRPLSAQDGTPDEETQAAAARAQLYETLARDSEAVERQSNVLKTVVKIVRPTVVHIEAQKTDTSGVRYGRKDQVEEAGSGCIIKRGGHDYVLTNRHVIKGAKVENITIRLADRRELHPKRFWTDPETDIAVMSLEAPGLIAARLGDSDSVDIGDFVLAVGSPFGLSHSITFGIVSATGRHDLVLGEGVKFQDFIQTDAAINPGNSGGPLINLRGEVVGMNTAIASNSGFNEGVGFSIAINKVVMVAKQLVERNTVVRGFLGVTLDRDFNPAMAISVGLKRPRGTRVTNVTPGSPAAMANLKTGDIILEYGGVSVDSDVHLINLVGMTEVGREVPLAVYRDKKTYKVMVRVGSNSAAKTTTDSEPVAP
jgi:serine protease Do